MTIAETAILTTSSTSAQGLASSHPWVRRLSKLAIGLGVTAALLLVIAYLPTPDEGYFWDRVYDTGHLAVFGLMTVAMLLVADGLLPRMRRRYHYLVAIAFATIIGLLVEIVQEFSGRTCEFIDLFSDIVGSLSFAAAFAIVDRRLDDPRQGILRRGPLAIVSFSMLAVGIAPLVSVCRMYEIRKDLFPVLIDFGQPWDGKFFYAQTSEFSRSGVPEGWPDHAAAPAQIGRFDASPGAYPGFFVIDVEPDWTRYQALEMDVYLDEQQGRDFTLRVHDKYHANWVHDRFRRVVPLRPGFQTLRVDLTDVKKGPRYRDLAMDKIDGFGLYTSDLAEPLRFYVGQVRLVQ